jgi:7-cyano-7-deazaguanine synthase
MRNLGRHGLPEPRVVSLSGYGTLLPSGLTDQSKRIYEDAFLPCRNLMFLTLGAAFAYQCGAGAVGIGLLDEAFCLFPDQTRQFVAEAEAAVCRAVARTVRVVTPLMTFSKTDVLKVAKAKGITNTYSCHAGTYPPCGECVACREYHGLEV